MTGVVVLVCALALTAGLGFWHHRTRGRFAAAATAPEAAVALDESAWTTLRARPGERATLLQFSSAFCAPCRATRVTLGEVAGLVPGVVHVEVDAEQHLDLVRRLGIASTPTTLVLDGRGAEASRAVGAPSRDQVMTTLSRIVDAEST